MRATVVDRLLPLLEAYAEGRQQQKALQREMRALACEREEEAGQRCYRWRPDGDEGHCPACAARHVLWLAFRERLAENNRLLAKIERLALRLSLPDPVEPPEPTPLLDLMTAGGDPNMTEHRRGARPTRTPPGRGATLPVKHTLDQRCTNDSPPWFTGRWRDWHRGHGCDKDDGQPRTPEGVLEIEYGGRYVLKSVAARQLLDLERDLRESLRGGYLFGNFDEPLDAASMRVVRVIQQRLSDLPCGCTDRTPDVGGYRCRACGGRLPEEGN